MTVQCKKCSTVTAQCPRCTPARTNCGAGKRKARYKGKKVVEVKCSFSSN